MSNDSLVVLLTCCLIILTVNTPTQDSRSVIIYYVSQLKLEIKVMNFHIHFTHTPYIPFERHLSIKYIRNTTDRIQYRYQRNQSIEVNELSLGRLRSLSSMQDLFGRQANYLFHCEYSMSMLDSMKASVIIIHNNL